MAQCRQLASVPSRQVSSIRGPFAVLDAAAPANPVSGAAAGSASLLESASEFSVLASLPKAVGPPPGMNGMPLLTAAVSPSRVVSRRATEPRPPVAENAIPTNAANHSKVGAAPHDSGATAGAGTGAGAMRTTTARGGATEAVMPRRAAARGRMAVPAVGTTTARLADSDDTRAVGRARARARRLGRRPRREAAIGAQ